MQNETQSTPVAIFPGGTGNDFCRSLNIFNYDDALNALLMGMSFQCDIGMFQTENRTRAFLTQLGFGQTVDVVELADRWRWLRRARYLAAGFKIVIANAPHTCSISIDDSTILDNDECRIVQIFNSQYSGNDRRWAPFAQLDDGLLDILISTHTTVPQAWQFYMFGLPEATHIYRPFVSYYRGQRVVVESHANGINCDGEIEPGNRAEIWVEPKAVRFIVRRQ